MKRSVCLIGPYPPPFAGMSVLSETLKSSLSDFGVNIYALDSNKIFFKSNFLGGLNRILQMIYYIFQFYKIILSNSVVIISSSGDFFYYKAVPAMIFSKLLGKPVLLDFVGGGILEKMNNSFVKQLKRFDKIMVPTKTFQNAFLQVGVDSILFPHIVNTSRFLIKKDSLDHIVLLAVKGLMSYSGVENLIKAFNIVKKKYPSAELLIAGDGPEKNNLQELVKKLKIDGISFLGNLPYSHMPVLFSKATIFIHGTKVESFGIVLVESMASGTPVVSTNVGGIPDIIENRKNGLLVEYGDVEGMAESIFELIEDKKLYDYLKINGLKKAEEFSPENLTQKLYNILDELNTLL